MIPISFTEAEITSLNTRPLFVIKFYNMNLQFNHENFFQISEHLYRNTLDYFPLFCQYLPNVNLQEIQINTPNDISEHFSEAQKNHPYQDIIAQDLFTFGIMGETQPNVLIIINDQIFLIGSVNSYTYDEKILSTQLTIFNKKGKLIGFSPYDNLSSLKYPHILNISPFSYFELKSIHSPDNRIPLTQLSYPLMNSIDKSHRKRSFWPLTQSQQNEFVNYLLKINKTTSFSDKKLTISNSYIWDFIIDQLNNDQKLFSAYKTLSTQKLNREYKPRGKHGVDYTYANQTGIPPYFHQVLNLTLAGYSEKEISEYLNWKPGTIKSIKTVYREQIKASSPRNFLAEYIYQVDYWSTLPFDINQDRNFHQLVLSYILHKLLLNGYYFQHHQGEAEVIKSIINFNQQLRDTENLSSSYLDSIKPIRSIFKNFDFRQFSSSNKPELNHKWLIWLDERLDTSNPELLILNQE